MQKIISSLNFHRTKITIVYTDSLLFGKTCELKNNHKFDLLNKILAFRSSKLSTEAEVKKGFLSSYFVRCPFIVRFILLFIKTTLLVIHHKLIGKLGSKGKMLIR